MYPKKSVGHAKARFMGIANITNGEFQGHYAPLDNDQQMYSASSQQAKGETIVQSIMPIHVMPTPQAKVLMPPMTDHVLITQMCTQSVDLPLWITHPQRSIGDHQIINQQNDTV